MPLNRAMTEAQKDARRADILRVALHRFTRGSYEELSMAETAEQAGVAKGTLYLYFRSKEEMFLAVYADELNAWFDELDRQLAASQGEASIAGFVDVLSESLARRPQLLRLIAIVHTVLERKLDHAAALRFMTWFKDRLTGTGALIEKYLPFLSPGQGIQLMLKINALVIGLQHMAEPSGATREVLAEGEFAVFRVDLHTALLETLSTLLMGFAYEAKYRHDK